MGFPDGLDGKASAWNAGDPGLIPGLGRYPGEGNGNPLQYSCLENSMDGGAWWATVHGVSKSQTRLSDFPSLPYSLPLSTLMSYFSDSLTLLTWWWFSRWVMSNSCNPMDCSLPASSAREILQARILEWVAISFSRGSSQPRNWTWVSCIAGRFFTNWAMREALTDIASSSFTLPLTFLWNPSRSSPLFHLWIHFWNCYFLK